jgi:hypothetical protein
LEARFSLTNAGLYRIVDLIFGEFLFHALGCITDLLRKNGLHDWIGALT